MGPTPGWYDTPADPLVRLGLMMPEVLDGVLPHGTVSFEPAAPDGLSRPEALLIRDEALRALGQPLGPRLPGSLLR
jgi:hypothetical protein